MIKINLNKAKEIAHNIRRDMRAEDFKPLDEVIAKQIPGVPLNEIEADRQSIRDKYTNMQERIDEAATPDEILRALNNKYS